MAAVTEFIGRHEPGKILTVLERRKFESTTEIPNRMSGPKNLGLTDAAQICY